MRNLFLLGTVLLMLSYSCTNSKGELTGTQGREPWYNTQPHGMVYIPNGSFLMGPNDQDVSWAMTAQQRRVSVFNFWMDETEITNNEYRQFVTWVRDSIAYRLLGENDAEKYLISTNSYEEEIDPPMINWQEFGGPAIPYSGKEEREFLNPLYYQGAERFWNRRDIDVRKLNFEYFWIDYAQAAKKSVFEGQERRSYNYKESRKSNFQTPKYDGEIVSYSIDKEGQVESIKDRSSYIMKNIVNVYPDTLCWISDFTYSYNEPMCKSYFWHPAYDNYPVVGVTWEQANAFSIWRTNYLNRNRQFDGLTQLLDYRLPTEAEWEYAARGGDKKSMYPFGGYYPINPKGCYIANFKPLRGNYPADGGFYTVVVAVNEPNDFGLYDMAGNVSEWCIDAFHPSSYSFNDDMNSVYKYNARPEDNREMKRKVIRGGSWKDISFYMQCGTRSYEYADSSKSNIGFRCVQDYLGEEYNANGSKSRLY